jgi:hypothetical protein
MIKHRICRRQSAVYGVSASLWASGSAAIHPLRSVAARLADMPKVVCRSGLSREINAANDGRKEVHGRRANGWITEMSRLYPDREPFGHGLLDVGDGHLVYWESCGDPLGKPALVLHGGPGSGASAFWRRLFDPKVYVTSTPAEHRWLTRDLGRIFPEQWERFRDTVPEDVRGGNLPAAFARLPADPDETVRGTRPRAPGAPGRTHSSPTCPAADPTPGTRTRHSG